jgi:hypothetical protein
MMETKEIELKLTVAEVNGVLQATRSDAVRASLYLDSEDSAAGRTASSGTRRRINWKSDNGKPAIYKLVLRCWLDAAVW